jgi:hypothetical protein
MGELCATLTKPSRQFGVADLQLGQLPHQRIVVGVADFGLVEHVVQVFVPAKQLPELANFRGGIFIHGAITII